MYCNHITHHCSANGCARCMQGETRIWAGMHSFKNLFEIRNLWTGSVVAWSRRIPSAQPSHVIKLCTHQSTVPAGYSILARSERGVLTYWTSKLVGICVGIGFGQNFITGETRRFDFTYFNHNMGAHVVSAILSMNRGKTCPQHWSALENARNWSVEKC
jgi:hypothetical protein